MAVSFNPNAFFDRLISPALALPVTIAGWFRLDADLNNYTTICWLGNDSSTDNVVLLALNSDGVTPTAYDAAFDEDCQGTPLTVGVWYYLAITAASGAGNFKLYQAAENTTLALADSATYGGTFAGEKIGLGGGRPDGESIADNADGTFACWRLWTAELSLAELQVEMRSATAIRTSHLQGDWRFPNVTDCRLDQCGLGNHLTYTPGTGSLATGTDPGFTWGRSATAGLGRVLTGSGADRVKRSNLTDLAGTLWEAATDWFFGYSTVDYDWRDAGDAALFTQWTFSADQNTVAAVNVLPTANQVEITAVSGDADGLSNLRELHTIPETATWGVAHAQCEIHGGPKFLTGNTLDEGRLVIKPQHGIGLRAQEDNRRRTIIAWHDIAIGLPQAINLGVWSGNLDGTGFLNRQINLGMDLDEVYTPTACEQTCDDDAGLVFDGTAANWETPDHADLEMGTGDWSAKIDVTVSDWTPAAQTSLFSKYNTVGNNRSYRLYLTTTGQFVVATSVDGNGGGSLTTFTLDASGTSVVSALANGSRRTILIDYDADNGSGNRAVTFHLGESWDGPFTQLGATITNTGTATCFNGAAVFELGAVNDTLGERLTGRIHQFQIRKARLDLDGNQSTGPVIDIRAQAETNSATSFTDNVGRTFTRSGTASLENTPTPTGTATIGAHTLRVGDRVNISVGDELSITSLQRTNGQDCQCTLPGGHSITTGSYVRLLFCSDSSFDGLFAVNVSGNTMTWVDTGSNTSGHTGLAWDSTFDRQTATITAVGATTIDYETFGRTNAAIPIATNSRVIREFPYYMELKVEGTVAAVRCWGRHQTVPDWYDQDRALICDLSKAQRAFTVTNRSRSANVATLTIGTHDLIVGDRINIASVESSFNATNRIVTAISATTFSYANTGSDVSSTASSGTATAVGSGTGSQVVDNPCPVGTGRVAFVNAHLGTHDLCKCVYGPFFGDNDPVSQIVAAQLEAASATIDAGFTIPTPTAGQAGSGATVTPAVVAGAFGLPAPGESVGAGPATMDRAFTLPQAGATVVAGPAVAAAAFSLPATAESVAAGPATVAGQFALPAAGASVGAGPSILARAFVVAQPGVNVGAAPTAIPLAFVLGQAAPVTSGNATPAPAVLALSFVLPQATGAASSTVAPAALAAVTALPQPGLAVSAGPAVIARAWLLPQATPVITSGSTVLPATISRSFTLATPQLNVAAGPAALAGLVAVPQLGAGVSTVPAVLARSFALPAAVITVAGHVNPAVLAVVSALGQPGLSSGVTPGLVALAFVLPQAVGLSMLPDPNPVFITFAEGRSGRVSFTEPSLIVFEEPQ